MIQLLKLLARFGKHARPALIAALEALLNGDLDTFTKEGAKAARIAGVKLAAEEYLRKPAHD
jgi:hypothetical protein